MRRLFAVTLSAALLTGALSVTAMAADDPTIDDIYTAAKAGRLEQAQTMIEQVLRDHPNSSKAHFVQSELFAREGKIPQARSELAKAEAIKPDDSFASPRALQELKSQLGQGSHSGGSTTMMMQREAPASHFPWGAVVILALVVGVLWMVFRRRNTAAVPYNGAPSVAGGPAYGGPGPGYGPGYGAPPAGGGIGSGIAGGLASGLAVGAGVVAGEELAHHFLDGGRREGAPPPAADDNWQSSNTDMGGSDFGTSDSGSWDDSSGGGGGGGGGGDDWT